MLLNRLKEGEITEALGHVPLATAELMFGAGQGCFASRA
jgi:hypothetical protein